MVVLFVDSACRWVQLQACLGVTRISMASEGLVSREGFKL